VEQAVVQCNITENDLATIEGITVNITALVPNCTFDVVRPTGIFGETPKSASILERARQTFVPDLNIDVDFDLGFERLINGTQEVGQQNLNATANATDETRIFPSFTVPPEMRDLAKD